MRARDRFGLGLLALVVAACGGGAASPTPTDAPSAPTSDPASASAPPTGGETAVEPAPGSASTVYEPNPGAIVVAIDPGHGGCLDWGVPDPSQRGQAFAEETMTLAIGHRLRELLEAEGIAVVMVRDEDEALAGDDHPPLDCHGPPFRDVNGDGVAGFGSDVPEATRTRDELQARLDVANLAAADALVSIHINSPTEGGQQVEIAFTETFYTDETPWGPSATAALAQGVQAGVVGALDDVATYERGDRGITAHNFYIVAPTLFRPTAERPDPAKQPTRGGLMPVILSEVGSITLREEHDLLVTPEGQDAVAAGIFEGLRAFFTERALAARIALGDVAPGTAPEPVGEEGPPFWPLAAPDGPFDLRLTNTGTAAWPTDLTLAAGWEVTEDPYLARAPDALEALAPDVPALKPGESVVVRVELPDPPGAGSGRAVAWISLQTASTTTADHGSPALQLASTAP